MTKNYVIMCNDSVQGVCQDKIVAEKTLKVLSDEYFYQNKYAFDNQIDEYNSRIFWRIREVPLFLTTANLRCDDCKERKEDVEKTFCPYSEEINETQIEAYLCNECYKKRIEDI